MYIPSHGHSEPFNFDEWKNLASVDPDAFERRRQATIDEFLNNLPESKQRRLRGLQFRIDMERRRARSPLGACIKISSMMWESLVGPEGLTEAIHTLTHGRHSAQKLAAPRCTATVVSLRRTDNLTPRN